MSTTTPAARLRLVGTLLAAAALVAAPCTSALAEPSAEPTPTTSTTATTTASATPSPTGSVEPSTSPTPSASTSPTATAPTTTTPSPSASSRTSRAVSAAAVPGPTEPQTQAAADFIARTLDEFGEHYVYPDAEGDLGPDNFPDHGNTIDAMLALAAANAHAAQGQESLAWLESTIGSYLGTDFGDTYVGGTAKSLIGVVALGGDPTDVGGTDLVATLRDLETSTGRFSDTGSGDYTITITQALAVVALVKAGQPVTTRSVELLLDQQCADGGFRSAIGSPTCVSDPDATAFAAQALLAVDDALLCWADVEGTRAAAAAGADAALDHLVTRQAADGGIVNDEGLANANTTGVAGQAFVAAGRAEEAAAAAAFVATLQYDASAPVALRGAIAFSTAARTTGDAPQDSDIRATPQATLLLAGSSLLAATVPDAPAPPRASACPAEPTTTATPTTTPTTTPSVAPTDGAGGGGSGVGGDAGDDVASGPTGSLAQTGSDLLAPVGLGVALVLVGAIAVAASRRRGAHA